MIISGQGIDSSRKEIDEIYGKIFGETVVGREVLAKYATSSRVVKK